MADTYDVLKKIRETNDQIQWRPIVPHDTKRLGNALVKFFESNNVALQGVTDTYNGMEGEAMAEPVGHPDLYPYPEKLPVSLWGHLAEILRGKLPTTKEAAHYLWHAAGYGLFLWAGQEPPEGEPGLTREQCADILDQNLKAQATGVGVEALPPIPWRQIALFVLQLLAQYLGG